MREIEAVLRWIEVTGMEFPGFDRNYYLSCNSDVVESGIDPFRHYVEHGWKENRNPSAGFNGEAYFASNPDVQASGMNPLVHFVLYGLSENRALRADADPAPCPLAMCGTGIMPGFDRKFYLDQNPDVAIEGVDPLEHYIESGWKEGRNPSRGFDGELYLKFNSDIRSAAVNPLVHFLRFVLSEGRYWSLKQVVEIDGDQPPSVTSAGRARLL